MRGKRLQLTPTESRLGNILIVAVVVGIVSLRILGNATGQRWPSMAFTVLAVVAVGAFVVSIGRARRLTVRSYLALAVPRRLLRLRNRRL